MVFMPVLVVSLFLVQLPAMATTEPLKTYFETIESRKTVVFVGLIVRRSPETIAAQKRSRKRLKSRKSSQNWDDAHDKV